MNRNSWEISSDYKNGINANRNATLKQSNASSRYWFHSVRHLFRAYLLKKISIRKHNTEKFPSKVYIKNTIALVTHNAQKEMRLCIQRYTRYILCEKIHEFLAISYTPLQVETWLHDEKTPWIHNPISGMQSFIAWLCANAIRPVIDLVFTSAMSGLYCVTVQENVPSWK